MSVKEIYRQDETWLAVDPVVGCIKDCKYCFLQTYNQTPKKGTILAQPQETIAQLHNLETFDAETFLMLGSETDYFMSKKNIDYLLRFLTEYKQSGLKNTICLSTKSEIPADFLKELKNRNFTREDLIFYVSYSGLNKEIEPKTNVEDLRQSFINVKEYDFPAIHYWRPFLPDNSSEEKIDEILNFVSQYADCSICSGLKINDGILKNIAPFWPELLEQNLDYAKIASIWPKGIKQYIFDHGKEQYPDYPIFAINACALSFVKETSQFMGMQEHPDCLIANCPEEQRLMCQNSANHRELDLKAVKQALLEIGKKDNYELSIKGDAILVRGNLTHAQMIYLRRKFHAPFILEGNLKSRNEWGGTAINRADIEI